MVSALIQSGGPAPPEPSGSPALAASGVAAAPVTPPSDSALPTPPTHHPGGTGRPWRTRLPSAATAGVVAVLVIGGAVLWFTRPRMLDTDRVAHTIGERISQQVGETVTVHCPATARKRTGETFRCGATTATGTDRVMVVTVTDDRGGFTWRTQR